MEYLKVKLELSRRSLLILFIPYLTASSWYYLFSTQILGWRTQLANAYLNLTIAISLLVSISIVNSFEKLHIIYTWGATMPIMMILYASALNSPYLPVFIVLSGFLFGLGLLAYCVYFRSVTKLEERGRVSGMLIFASLLINPAILLFTENLGLLGALGACVFLGALTLLIPLLKRKEITVAKKNLTQEYKSRTILKYIIPWITFCFVNGISARAITSNVMPQFNGFAIYARIMAYIMSGFGALIGGLLTDWIGRRISLTVGLVSYGISTALSGLISTVGMFFLSYSTLGFSWGLFLAVYFLVIWGDLAQSKNCASLYAAGLIPFYLSTGLGYLIMPVVQQLQIGTTAFISSLLIFLSNLPLVFAPELLSEEKKKKMELKLYMEEVKKIKKEMSKEKQLH